MFALAKPGGIYPHQKVSKTADFILKPAVFMELVTWLEQATFSLRGLALAVFICVFLLLLLEKSCILRNFIWKLKRKVTIKFYQFLSFSKSGRQRVDIFLGVLLNYKAAFPCTCEFMYTGMFFLQIAQNRIFVRITVIAKYFHLWKYFSTQFAASFLLTKMSAIP